MPTIELTADKARQYMREAVEDAGADYVYRQHHSECLYVVGGEPACLIGHVLIKAGVGVEEFPTREGDDPLGLLGFREGQKGRAREREQLSGIAANESVARALTAAQEMQDAGATWGSALEEFEQDLAESAVPA